MVKLIKINNTLQKAPDSEEGNLFLNEPRELTRTQLPEGYSQTDDIHVLIELAEGNLVLFQYDNLTVNNVTFKSPQDLINYIFGNG